MPLVIVAGGVALLLLLMIRFKLNGFISLVLVALAVGIAQGMPVDKVIGSIKAGVGGTLGSLALIMGFGAMLGKLLADCGGAQRIATTLIEKFGQKYIQWAVVLTGFTVGFALFYEVGFVLLLPLVFSIAASARVPLLYVGVPMAAALSVTHGFLPPHPGPTAIATIFHADMGKTLLYGTLLAIPTVILAGPVYARFLKGIDKPVPEGLYNPKIFTEEEMPSFGISVATSLVPVILMALRAVAEMVLPKGHSLLRFAEFFGDPVMATLIAVLIAIFTFGLNRGRTMDEVMGTITDSIKIIAMMLLIIGGGGAFKQVLVDSGVEKYIAALMEGSNVSPILDCGCAATGAGFRYRGGDHRRRHRGPVDRHYRRQPGADGDRGRFRQRDFLSRQRSGVLAVQGVFQPEHHGNHQVLVGAGNHHFRLRPGRVFAAGDGGLIFLSFFRLAQR